MIIINVWKTKGNKSGLSTLCQMFLQISLRTLQDFPECHENRAVPFGTPERSPSICKEISQEQSVLIVGWKLNLSITFSVPTSLSPICLSAGERENKWKMEKRSNQNYLGIGKEHLLRRQKKRGEETWTKQVTEQNCGRKVKYIYTHAHTYIYINAIFRKKGRGRKLSLK